ncbi:hypothetical protein B9Z65_566 [Elsinoe australis]|uniref:Uncharacterized protein n=1 Tax=Elsinoe australis TaxID=40998 RepID=A0A2P8AIY2_9PEZI|nr:hypothetical protein B9Z65_566 [Elsinoe australis]
MTARTAVLEKANATTSLPATQRTNSVSLSPNQARSNAPRVTRSTSNQSSQSSHDSNQVEKTSNVRATWTGKVLIVTGLHPDQYPVGPPSTHYKPNGTTRKATRGANLKNASPVKSVRASLKRKRSGTNASVNGVYGDSQAPSDESQRQSNVNSIDGGSESDQEDGDDEVDVGDDHGGDEGPTTNSNMDATRNPPKQKRRRRGQRLLEQQAAEAARPPSPQLPFVDEEQDKLEDVDLPLPFLSRSPTPDPDDPNDEATKIYKNIYEPLTKAEAFVTALTKLNPAQRRTENLYEIAANTAAALRVWQDEYLEIDRLTAPHAPIPRKPATGSRLVVDPYLFEDQKEADIYDYIFDAKKVGHQNPIAQKVVRDASGRELRLRGPKTRITADNQLVNAANGVSEDDNGRRHRARRPVSKYDGVVTDGQRRKRGIGQVSESVENEMLAKRGRWSNGRGGRGRGRGGRGGANRLLDKRIRQMREESVGTAMSASAEDESGSDAGGLEPYSRDVSLAPSQEGQYDSQVDPDDMNGTTGEYKKKGRPKGSKNLHFRSDKGIPKGPRQPKTSTPDSTLASPAPSSAQPGAEGGTAPAAGAATANKQTRPGQKQPKSEKRSESMTIWWAKRKAAAAEQRRKEAEAAGLPPPVEKPKSRAPRSDKAQSAAKAVAPAATQPSAGSPLVKHQPAAPSPYHAPQRFSNGPSPPQPQRTRSLCPHHFTIHNLLHNPLYCPTLAERLQDLLRLMSVFPPSTIFPGTDRKACTGIPCHETLEINTHLEIATIRLGPTTGGTKVPRRLRATHKGFHIFCKVKAIHTRATSSQCTALHLRNSWGILHHRPACKYNKDNRDRDTGLWEVRGVAHREMLATEGDTEGIL